MKKRPCVSSAKGSGHMLLVSNMWPDELHPSNGVFVEKFFEHVKELGWSCDLVVMKKADTLARKTIGYVGFYVSSFFKSLFGKYDLVYIHYPSHSALAVLLARRLKKFTFVANVHGSDVLPVNMRQKKMHKYTLASMKVADYVVTPSHYFKEVVCEKYNLPRNSVFVYPSGGIDPRVFHLLSKKKVAEIQKSLGIDPNIPTICFAGRITEGKGWDTYLNAVSCVLKTGKQLNVLLVGSGDQDAECATLMTKLGLKDSIIRLGLQPQRKLCELYNASDYFVFPGRRRSESLGLVAIEAMACGTPVIASDFAAPRYYVNNGVNGWKVPAGDVNALAEVLKSINTNCSEYFELRDGALETASMFFRSKISDNLNEILNSCLD